jgi:hypothetical protein
MKGKDIVALGSSVLNERKEKKSISIYHPCTITNKTKHNLYIPQQEQPPYPK